MRWGIPGTLWRLRFYDRREIKDLLSYLRCYQPADTVSLLRGSMRSSAASVRPPIQQLTDAANQLGIPLWDVVIPKRCVLWAVPPGAAAVLRFG